MKKDGFSTIEVTISVLLIGIITAVVGVNLTTFSEYNKIEKTAWCILKDISSTRSLAMKCDCPVQITFANDSFTVHQDENCDGLAQSNEMQKVIKLPDNINFKLSYNAPSNAPPGATLPINGNFAGGQWNDKFVVGNNEAFAINPGSIYLSSSRVKKITFCIYVSANMQNIQMYKWDGFSWINLQ